MGNFVVALKFLLLVGKWTDPHQTCTSFQVGPHPGCAQAQRQGEGSRYGGNLLVTSVARIWFIRSSAFARGQHSLRLLASSD